MWLADKKNPISKSLRLVLSEVWKANEYYPEGVPGNVMDDDEDPQRKAAKEELNVHYILHQLKFINLSINHV